jgi:membrane protease YdiL (CAAX protease family)
MRQKLDAWLQGLGGEPTVIVCGASLVLVVSHYQGAAGYLRTLTGNAFDALPYSGVLGHLWWFGSSLGFYLVLPLLFSALTGGSFHRRYGLGLGDWKAGLAISVLLLAVMLPVVWVAAQLPSFKGQYPLAGSASYLLGSPPRVSFTLFACYELAYVAYFVSWEFLFRGWMVNGLLPYWGKAAAVLVQVAPFAIMHLGKAELETVGSIVAGVALGILSLRTRSIWYGVLIHGTVAVWMDWLSAKAALLGS